MAKRDRHEWYKVNSLSGSLCRNCGIVAENALRMAELDREVACEYRGTVKATACMPAGRTPHLPSPEVTIDRQSYDLLITSHRLICEECERLRADNARLSKAITLGVADVDTTKPPSSLSATNEHLIVAAARAFVEAVMCAWWLHGTGRGSRWWTDAANQFADLREAFGVPEDWEGDEDPDEVRKFDSRQFKAKECTLDPFNDAECERDELRQTLERYRKYEEWPAVEAVMDLVHNVGDGNSIRDMVTGLAARAEIGREALQYIVDRCGGVCDDFGICSHRSCQASLSAWIEPDRALTAMVGDGPRYARRDLVDELTTEIRRLKTEKLTE